MNSPRETSPLPPANDDWKQVALKILRLENAGRSYRDAGREIAALKGACISIGKGEFLAVSGPSGSGKTTLLSILGFLITPDTGEVFYKGAAASGIPEKEKSAIRSREIGFVFQEVVMMEGLNVWENVVIPAVIGRSGAASREAAAGLLERVGLADRLVSSVRGLSFGERKRVALARALAGSPELILADEPTSGLDSATADSVFSILQEANSSSGITVVFATHDERYAAKAGRRVELRDGTLIE